MHKDTDLCHADHLNKIASSDSCNVRQVFFLFLWIIVVILKHQPCMAGKGLSLCLYNDNLHSGTSVQTDMHIGFMVLQPHTSRDLEVLNSSVI